MYTVYLQLSICSIHQCSTLLGQKDLKMWKNIRLVLGDNASIGLMQWLLIIPEIETD